MKLNEIYGSIENPLDDPNVMRKLISIYSKIGSDSSIQKPLDDYFYEMLVKTTSKDNVYKDNRKFSDRFYSMMFNKWKDSITSMSRAEFDKLFTQGDYGKDFIEMRNFLINVANVSTWADMANILSSNENLKNAFHNYMWYTTYDDTWKHVKSSRVTANKNNLSSVEHRLYLNLESTDIHQMLIYFVEKCSKYNLPYYFKFAEAGNRDDTVVIYSSTKYLAEYIDVLMEIKNEHPEFVSSVKAPPILTGKIDGWIGYGSEPGLTPDGKKTSFNSIRTKAIISSMDDSIKDWLISNSERTIMYMNEEMSCIEYIARISIENLINGLKSEFLRRENHEKRVAEKGKRLYSPEDLEREMGYSLQWIESSVFKETILEQLRCSIPKAVSILSKGGEFDDIPKMYIKLKNNSRKCVFSGDKLRGVMRKQARSIAKEDSTFVSLVRDNLKKSAPKWGIDSEKYCFDIKSKEMIERGTIKSKLH